MPTIGPISVAADGDDGTIQPAWTFQSAGEGGLGEGYFGGDASAYYWLFCRFVLPSAIPAGATINAGTILELFGLSTFNWGNGVDDLVIAATDAPNPAAPTTSGERPSLSGGSTALTAASVAWNDVTWATSAWNTSPDLASIIQELVDDNGGLASGAAIIIWVRGVLTSAIQVSCELNEKSGTANVAKLTIVYTAGAGTLDQEGFRFRNDDGDETTATFDGDQDAELTKSAGTERIRIIVNASGDPDPSPFQIEWSKVGEDVWRKIES